MSAFLACFCAAEFNQVAERMESNVVADFIAIQQGIVRSHVHNEQIHPYVY
jgi:hypothetical protein